MAVTVVKVVDNANMLRIMVLVQVGAHRCQIGRLATPAAVVVQAELAAHFFGARHQRQKLFSGSGDLGFLRVARGLSEHEPHLGRHFVFLKETKRLFVHAPKGGEFQPVLFVLQNFLLKLRHVFCAPIVGHALKPKPFEHRRPFRRPALLSVERHNAPSNELVLGKIVSSDGSEAAQQEREQGQANHGGSVAGFQLIVYAGFAKALACRLSSMEAIMLRIIAAPKTYIPLSTVT